MVRIFQSVSIKNLANHWIQIDAERFYNALFFSAKWNSDFSVEILVVHSMFYCGMPFVFRRIKEKSERIDHEYSKNLIFSVEKSLNAITGREVERTYVLFFSTKTSELVRGFSYTCIDQ